MAEEMRKHISPDIIVDNVITSETTLVIAPLQLASAHKQEFYLNEKPKNFRNAVTENGRGFLPPKIISTSFGEKFAEIFIGEKSIGLLSDIYETPVDTFIITQYFQVGAMVDRLTENASASGKLLNYMSFHRSLYHIFQFLGYFGLKKTFIPFECELANVKDGIVFQVQMKLAENDDEVLRNVFSKNEDESTHFLIREFLLAVEDSDFADVNFIKKTGRLIVTQFFHSDSVVRLGGYRFSDVLALKPREAGSTIVGYPGWQKVGIDPSIDQYPDYLSKNKNTNDQTSIITSPIAEQNLATNGSTIDAIEKVVDEEKVKDQFANARKFSYFIKKTAKSDDHHIELNTLSDMEVLNYLDRYPRKEAVENLDKATQDLVCVMVRDEQVYEDINKVLENVKVAGLLEKNSDIQKIISEKNIEDVVEIITLKSGNEFEEEYQKVRGWLDRNKEEALKISANYDELNSDEKWAIRREQLINEIESDISKVKSLGNAVSENDYAIAISRVMGVPVEDANTLVKGIVEEAGGFLVSKRVDALREKIEAKEAQIHINLPTQVTQLGAVESVKKVDPMLVNKLEDNLKKMKKIMDMMKVEITRLREQLKNQVAKAILPEERDLETQLTQVELEKTKATLENKEKFFKKFKEDMENVLREKDKQIAYHKGKLELAKLEVSKSEEVELRKKNEVLQADNRALRSRLDIMTKKIQIMSENIEKQESDINQRKDKEVDQLKVQVNLSQSLVQKFKEDKQKVDTELATIKEKFSKFESEKFLLNTKSDGTSDQLKLEAKLNSLAADKKSLEDQLKAQSQEMKKMEQKMKILIGQNEEMTKKKGGSAKNIENAHKQVEAANHKAQEAQNEVAEKKKELLKLKNENLIQHARIQELEKKLLLIEKSKVA